MVTPLLLTGFETGILDSHQPGSGTGLLDSTSGTVGIDSSTPISGLYSAFVTFDRVTAANITKNLPTPAALVGSSRFRAPASNPEQVTTIYWMTPTGNTAKIRLNTDGTIGVQLGGGATAWSAVNVCDGAVHRVGWRLDVSGTTWTLDWSIDGVAQAQATLGGQVAATISNFRWGSANAGDGSTAGFTVRFDDTLLTGSAGDWPLPNFETRTYRPTADGTHVAGTNVIEADTGTDIGNTTAYNLLDDDPFPTGTPAGDWVQQSQIDTGKYAEVEFADESSAPGDLLGVAATLAYWSSGTSANNGTTRICLADGSTLTDVLAGDMSENVMTYRQKVLDTPGGGWSATVLNGLKARVGFSSDVTPIPRWSALLLTAAWRIEQTGAAALTGAGAATATGNTAQAASATASGAGALSATAVREALGTAALTGVGDLVELHNLFEQHVQFQSHIPFGDGDRTPAEVTGAATLAGTSGGSATGLQQVSARADLTGLGALTAGGVQEQTGAASAAGTGDLVATPGPRSAFATAALSGAGALVAEPDGSVSGAAHLAGAGALVALADTDTIPGAVLVSASSDLIATGVVVPAPTGDAPFVERAAAWTHVPAIPARTPHPDQTEVAWETLDPAGRAEYLRVLAYSHRAGVRIDVLDADENAVGSLTAPTSVLYDGAISVDTTADVVTRLDISVVDPDHELLDFVAGSAVAGAIAPSSLLQVTRLDFVPALGQWITHPVFTGTVTAYNREGPDVAIEAMAKEYLYLGAERNWRSVSVRRGARVVDAIKVIAQARGERRFRLPELGARLPANVHVPQGAQAWPTLQRLADMLGREVLFDGAGLLTLRLPPSNPSWFFVRPGNLDTEPQTSFDLTLVKNAIQVLGKAPARGARPSYLAVLPAPHPLSPQSLARNGVPRYIVERMETELTAHSELVRVGQARLANRSIAGTTAAFDARPLPPIMPGDVATLDTEDLTLDFRLSSYSQPLLATASLQVGEVRYIPTRARRRSYTPGRKL